MSSATFQMKKRRFHVYKFVIAKAIFLGTSFPKILLLFILPFFSYLCIAQDANMQFRHLSNEDGLSQNFINHIVQDKIGFLWIGTNDGLNRYDGHNITTYKNNFADKNSLINDDISVLNVDNRNRLWIGSESGVCYYDLSRDLFVPIEKTRPYYINGIHMLDNGNMCFSSNSNFFEYNVEEDSLISLYNGGNPLNYELFTGSILQYAEGKYFVSTRRGLFKYDTKLKVLEPLDVGGVDKLKHVKINSLFQDSFGNTWVGTDGKGVFQLKTLSDSLYLVPIDSLVTNNSFKAKVVTAFVEDNEGNLWIASEDGYGIYLLNLKDLAENKASLLNLQYTANDHASICGNHVVALNKDKDGTIWVGTTSDGLSYFNKYFNKFNLIQHVSGSSTGLNHKYVSSICEDDTFLWIGTPDGLNRWNRKTDTWKYYPKIASNGNHSVTTLFNDSRNNLWVGTWGGGLNRFNKATETFTTYMMSEDDENSISNNNIFGIAEDVEGRIWVATMGGGLSIYDYNTNDFVRFSSEDQVNSISNNWLKHVIRDRKGNMWIASSYGLNKFNIRTGKFEFYFKEEGNSKSLPNNSLVCLYEDSKGTIWLGTNSGLCRYNADSNNFVMCKQENIPSKVIRGICEDLSGNLWISTNKGLTKFINAVNLPDTVQYTNYGIDDGLQGNEFNSKACYRTKDGTMFFGGTNGLNFFHPEGIPKNYTPPTIVLTELLIFNKTVEVGAPNSPLKESISVSSDLVLNYDQSVLTFRYAALNYIAPEKNAYKYKMKGFDKGWNVVDNKTEATYTNLNPGNYEFIVAGANSDGVWNEDGVKLTITILPPWWKTIWFRSISAISLLGIILGFYFWRINELNKQKMYLAEQVNNKTGELRKYAYDLNRANIKLQEQAEELRAQTNELSEKNEDLKILNSTKDKFFSIIAHDLKNPFSSMLGLGELLKTRYDKYDEEKRKKMINAIHENSTRSYKLLENLLEWARSQTGGIQFNPEKINLHALVRDSKLFVSESIESKSITFENKVPEDAEIFADKNMMNTILRNLVTNAVKFCEHGSVRVLFMDYADFQKIIVQDEGIGMNQDILDGLFKIENSTHSDGTQGEKGTGLGLLICKEFVNYHNGTIKVESKVGEGATFTIEIPKKSLNNPF